MDLAFELHDARLESVTVAHDRVILRLSRVSTSPWGGDEQHVSELEISCEHATAFSIDRGLWTRDDYVYRASATRVGGAPYHEFENELLAGVEVSSVLLTLWSGAKVSIECESMRATVIGEVRTTPSP